jgi:hypothetical protein
VTSPSQGLSSNKREEPGNEVGGVEAGIGGAASVAIDDNKLAKDNINWSIKCLCHKKFFILE